MNWKCPICFEGKNLPMIFNCGHTVCFSCKDLDNCPFCKEKITNCVQNFDLNKIVKAEIPAGYLRGNNANNQNIISSIKTRINNSTSVRNLTRIRRLREDIGSLGIFL